MGKVNVEKMKKLYKKRQKERKKRKSRGKTSFFKAEEGLNRLRILPPWGDTHTDFAIAAPYHYNVGESAYVCLKYKDEDCPICEVVEELFSRKKPKDTELAKKMRAKTRYFSNVVDLENDPKRVQVFPYGETIHDELLSYFADNDYGDITDVKTGYGVKIDREGEGIETRYKVRLDRNPSKLKDWKKIKKQLIDLEKLIEGDLRSYEELKAILEGVDPDEIDEDDADTDEDEDEEDDDDEDESSSKKSKKSKKDADEDDDEDEDDEEEDDDDDDEDEDEDDEEEDDDEDEDEDSDDDEEESDDDDEDEDDEEEDDDESEEDEDEEEDDDSSTKGKKAGKAASALERLRKMKKQNEKKGKKSPAKGKRGRPKGSKNKKGKKK